MKKVLYKEMEYILLFDGQTKFGRRAHLKSLDGARDFWVDSSLVRTEKPKPVRSSNPATTAQAPATKKRRPARDWPGKECPICGSEDLDAKLHCWECGYTGSR